LQTLSLLIKGIKKIWNTICEGALDDSFAILSFPDFAVCLIIKFNVSLLISLIAHKNLSYPPFKLKPDKTRNSSNENVQKSRHERSY